MWNLDDPGLHELQAVARAGLDREHHRVDRAGDIGLRLADSDGLDQHPIEHGAHQHHGGDGQFREATEPIARRHGADEDAGILRIGPQPGTVPQQRAAGAARRRIDRDHADRLAGGPPSLDQTPDQRGFADARRTRKADRLALRITMRRGQQSKRRRIVGRCFDCRQRLGERALTAGPEGGGIRHHQAVVATGRSAWPAARAACAAARRAIGTR